jgi:hypothetical protein
VKLHSRLSRPWLLLGGAVFGAGHIFLFSRARHIGLSLPVLAGVVLLLIAIHLGVLGPVYALFRRRSRR